MKKGLWITMMIFSGLLLVGCESSDERKSGALKSEEMSAASGNILEESAWKREDGVKVAQGGPYGELALTLPRKWEYELCPADRGNLMTGMYGIRFHPEGVSEGYVELAYSDSFGVCGTGLTEEEVMLAGSEANIGTYDEQKYWDFVTFSGENDGIVARTYSVGRWWEEYGGQVMDILDTLSFDTGRKGNNTYIDDLDSEAEEIALSLSLKNITPTGATLVFEQYDREAPAGELIYGEDFTIEVQKDDKWEAAPVVVDGEYGFNAVGILIACEEDSENGITEDRIDWEWLYGKLTPGKYRLSKSVDDGYEGGNNQYMLYAYFTIEDE